MQYNKNGILVQTPEKRQKRKRKPLNMSLKMRRFILIDDEAEVEILVPHFSPVIELLEGDGWREVKGG